MIRTETSQPFGFQVLVPDGERPWPIRDYDVGLDEYGVLLPHQCDSWVIAASTDPMEVLNEAKRFRAELDAAIVRLAKAVE